MTTTIDYTQAHFRKYSRLIKELKPDHEAYKAAKNDPLATDELALDGISSSTRVGIDRMVEDMKAQYVLEVFLCFVLHDGTIVAYTIL